MLWVEEKYARYVGGQLNLFVVTTQTPFVANFRCPYCGDSQKDRFKKRGYFHTHKNKIFFSCHNCGESRSMGHFLKEQNDSLYSEYVLELFKEGTTKARPTKKKEVISPDKLATQQRDEIYAIPLTSLSNDHPTLKYAKSRRIPDHKLSSLYHTDNFRGFVNKYIPDKLLPFHEIPRLVMPFIDKNNHLFGCQGRTVHAIGPRYITLVFDDRQRAFGEDKLKGDPFICEGPIDSLFIENGIASCGSDLMGLAKLHRNPVLVYDNEPRSKEICAQMERAIDNGFPLVIWPNSCNGIKDINDMVMKDIDAQDVVANNIHKGLSARLLFSNWKKC